MPIKRSSTIVARIIISTFVILIWLGVSGIGGPFFGKLSEVSSNDQAAFLPASAESTKAGEWSRRFSRPNQIPALVVAGFNTSVSESDLPRLGAAGKQLSTVQGVNQVVGPLVSDDRQAVQYIVFIDTASVDAKEAIAQLRELLPQMNVFDKAEAHVAGPAGLSADLVSAFSGIDGILLIVTLGAVLVILVVVYRSILLPLLVMLTAVSALCASILVVYLLAKADVIQLNG